MKRISAFLFVWLLAGGALLPAQTPEAAAAIADKDAAEERYKRLTSMVESLQESQRGQGEMLPKIVQQMRELREEQIKQGGAYASLDSVRKLADAIQEVDRKREADKKLILEEINKLAKLIAASPVAPATPPKTKPNPEATKPPTAKEVVDDPKWKATYEHVIRPGDTLTLIAKAYRENNIKVSVDDIIKANPNLDPNKLRPGQKIVVPQARE